MIVTYSNIVHLCAVQDFAKALHANTYRRAGGIFDFHHKFSTMGVVARTSGVQGALSAPTQRISFYINTDHTLEW